MKLFYFIRPLTAGVIALVLGGSILALANNYNLTQGSGTAFGSIVVSAVNYPQYFLCDATTPSQCTAVSAGGALKVDGSGVTGPVNVSQMGGTSINSGCVAALNGFPAAIPATVCGIFGTYVINAQSPGAHNIANSLTQNCATDQCGQTYNTIAASQTAQALTGGGGGATGDYLGFCTIYPTSTSPGVLTVFDNTSTAANNAIAFAGGSSSLSNLTPINIPVGSKSVNGAWKVTTGANMVVTCNGHFT